jgi:hypothetical protein
MLVLPDAATLTARYVVGDRATCDTLAAGLMAKLGLEAVATTTAAANTDATTKATTAVRLLVPCNQFSPRGYTRGSSRGSSGRVAEWQSLRLGRVKFGCSGRSLITC